MSLATFLEFTEVGGASGRDVRFEFSRLCVALFFCSRKQVGLFVPK